MSHFLRRRESLAKAIEQAGLDALLVSKAVNVSYLTGFTGDSSFLLVLPKRTILLSDERFRTQIADECPDVEAELRGADRNTYQLIGQVVEQLGLRNVGVEAAGLTLEEYERLKGWFPLPTGCLKGDWSRPCGRSRMNPKSPAFEKRSASLNKPSLLCGLPCGRMTAKSESPICSMVTFVASAARAWLSRQSSGLAIALPCLTARSVIGVWRVGTLFWSIGG